MGMAGKNEGSILKNSINYKNLALNKRQLCDLELILNGGFNPLDGFLREDDYNSVVNNMRLSNGEIWPMPIVLPINDKDVNTTFNINENIKLTNEENLPLAIMKIESMYKPDLKNECIKV